MDFNEVEAGEGVRLAWNAWPSSRIEATRMVVPFGVICNPVAALPEVPLLPYEPILCKGCRGVLNPYCRIDLDARIWVCQFCFQRNHFPPSYNGMSATNMPRELFPNSGVVEYVVSSQGGGGGGYMSPSGRMAAAAGGGFGIGMFGSTTPPGFLFVVDTCVTEEDLAGLKNAIKQLLGTMPETALVGLVSYGTMVQVSSILSMVGRELAGLGQYRESSAISSFVHITIR
jgi:protein transport protein SEC23